MSTKTTLKRIALVAVSALGLSVLASGPSMAANTLSTAFTNGATLNTGFLTVVKPTSGTAATTTGFFYIDIANESVAANSPTAVGLAQGFETITLAVTESTTAASSFATLQAMPVNLETVTGSADATALRFDRVSGETFQALTIGNTSASYGGSKLGNMESLDFNPTANVPNSNFDRYWFAVRPGAEQSFGAGYYKIRIRINTADSTIIDRFISVRFVNEIQDAAPAVSISVTGSVASGESVTFTTANSISATLTSSTNSDRIQIGAGLAGPTDSPTLLSTAPALNAAFVDKDNVVLSTGASNIQVRDSGVAAVDHVAPTAKTNASTDAKEAEFAAARALANGVYGVTADSAPTFSTDETTNKIRVRVNNTDVVAYAAVSTFSARSTITTATAKLEADGVLASDLLVTGTLTAGSDSTVDKAYTLPLTAKTAKLTIDGANAANKNLTTKVTWSGNYASANVTPATDTTLTTLANSDGEITREITNSAPVAGARATVTVTGFKDGGQVIITLSWAAAAVDSVTVLEPVADVMTALKGTTSFSVVVKDQFGKPMANEQLQPTLSTGSANYAAATRYAVITTNASGIATWSLTDAAATTTKGDSVTFTSVSVSGEFATRAVSYLATVPAVGSFLTYYHETWSTTGTSINNTVPSTGIYTSAGRGHTLKYDIDLSKDLTSVTDNDSDALFVVRARALTAAGAAATGASVTVTAGNGAHILGLDNLPTTTRTFGVPTSGDVTFRALATKSGAMSWTITSGSTSATVSFWVATPTSTAARTIAVSGKATGTANDAGVPMSVTVTDRYGNPVSEVLITLVASGVGSFAGGATTQSYTTDATGEYTFMARSNVAAGGNGTFKATIATSGTAATSAKGYHLASEVDSTLAAGISSASATVAFAAGEDPAAAAATAATDAALEAIDAANAATDAANLAAEAADAATVAAEEARDAADAATAAVEALASEVATLIASLKAQITTLANTVAKIAKRVRA